MTLAKLTKLKSGLFALGDQAVVSLTNAAAGILMIQYADKLDYAIYALLFSAILLVQGVQMALVVSPFTTSINQADDRKEHQTQVANLSLLFALLAMGLSSVIYVAVGSVADFKFSLAGLLCFMLAVFGIVLRESVRAVHYADKDTQSAFFNNLKFALGSALILVIASALGGVSTDAVLLAFGLSGVVSAAPKLMRWGRFSGEYFSGCSNYFRELFKSGRWALKGAVLTWFNTNSYNYIVTLLFGAMVVADIAASRLFWMPVGLVIAGWGSVFRPYISGWYKAGSTAQTKRLVLISILAGAVLLALYELIIQLTYALLNEWGFLAGYNDISNYLLLWGIFFFLAFARSSVGATLMVSQEGYRLLSHVAVLGLGVLMLTVPFLHLLDARYMLIILIAIEAAQLVMSLIYMKKFVEPGVHVAPLEALN